MLQRRGGPIPKGARGRGRGASRGVSRGSAKKPSKVHSPRRQSVDALLKSRPTADKLAAKNLMPNDKVAAKLQGTSATLEHKIRRDSVGRGLSNRPDLKDLKSQGVLKSERNLSSALQGTASKLDRKIKKDQVSQLLEVRPDLKELERTGVHAGTTVAPSIQERRVSLSRKMNKDQVSQLLDSRPEDITERARRKSSSVSQAIAPTAASLEQKVKAAQVAQKLKSRPGPEELKRKQVLPADHSSEIAPAIAPARHQLQTNLRRASLNRGLTSRKYDRDAEAPQQTALDSEKQTRRAQLAIALKGAAHLFSLNLINATQRGLLKELILSEDNRILAAVHVFQLDHDVTEMLDTFFRILEATIENLQK